MICLSSCRKCWRQKRNKFQKEKRLRKQTLAVRARNSLGHMWELYGHIWTMFRFLVGQGRGWRTSSCSLSAPIEGFQIIRKFSFSMATLESCFSAPSLNRKALCQPCQRSKALCRNFVGPVASHGWSPKSCSHRAWRHPTSQAKLVRQSLMLQDASSNQTSRKSFAWTAWKMRLKICSSKSPNPCECKRTFSQVSWPWKCNEFLGGGYGKTLTTFKITKWIIKWLCTTCSMISVPPIWGSLNNLNTKNI